MPEQAPPPDAALDAAIAFDELAALNPDEELAALNPEDELATFADVDAVLVLDAAESTEVFDVEPVACVLDAVLNAPVVADRSPPAPPAPESST